MRTINDPSGLNAELVERLVGLSAYEVVKLVAAYLPEIQLLAPDADAAENLAALAAAHEQILLLVPEIPELLAIAENLEGLITGLRPATSITYGTNGMTVQQALDLLLYSPIAISGFTLSPSVAEVGSAVTSVVLNWALSRSGTIQKLNGYDVNPAARTYTSTIPVGVDTTYTLHVEDAGGEDLASEASVQLRFKRKRYWGVSTSTSLTDAQIITLNNEFADDRIKTVNFDATGGRYIYYAYPAAFGLPSIKVQGFAFSDFTLTSRSFQNASNSAALYNIIRFNGLQTGSNIEVAFT